MLDPIHDTLRGALHTKAVVLQAPQRLALSDLDLSPMAAGDVVVDIAWSGISTGTERLLWSGRMPDFPGMGYPLVPGYESVGHVVDGPADRRGQFVFVPGARCFGEIRGLFGGAAARLVVPADRVVPLPDGLGADGVLLALAATARHALAAPQAHPPELIVGHGVLGRLLARLTVAEGHPPPTVWETDATRRDGADGYAVVDPAADPRADYRAIYDVSGAGSLLDTLIARLAPGGEVVLAGFYAEPLSFAFPPAFLREARLRCAAEWREADLAAVAERIADGRLSLAGLITHCRPAAEAAEAYQTAFSDAACLKMILDWRGCQ